MLNMPTGLLWLTWVLCHGAGTELVKYENTDHGSFYECVFILCSNHDTAFMLTL